MKKITILGLGLLCCGTMNAANTTIFVNKTKENITVKWISGKKTWKTRRGATVTKNIWSEKTIGKGQAHTENSNIETIWVNGQKLYYSHPGYEKKTVTIYDSTPVFSAKFREVSWNKYKDLKNHWTGLYSIYPTTLYAGEKITNKPFSPF